MKKWSRNHDRCLRCQKRHRKHMAKGLCSLCYFYIRHNHKTDHRWSEVS